ncbi:MAG: M61 family metallopeptidase, partial [Burkholderiales bacterium]
MINYLITPLPNTHTYHIILTFLANHSEHELKLPAWIPGSYMIREFSKNILNLTARQNTLPIRCQQINKNTWQLTDLVKQQLVEIEYTVYAYEFGIRTAYLDHTRGYFNNTSLCLYLVGSEELPHSIQLKQLPQTWQVATGLTLLDANSYIAKDYAELIDCPFELGAFTRLEFLVKEVPHYLMLSGTIPKNFDATRLIADLTKICATQIDLFGGIAPFTSYTFLLYLGGEIFTGLEHSNSTALMAPYYALPSLQQSKINPDYLKLLGLISHEYFHAWNVKRIKPQAFNPYNLDAESYTKLLWWFEGITSYYDDLILYRCGLIDYKAYLQLVLDNINDVYKFKGVQEQSLANSSLTSWIKYYRQDENSPNSIVSYYMKGALVGLCLDLLIRQQTQQHKSLDDVMLGLYTKWQLDGLGIGEEELPRLIQHYTGCDLACEIRQFIESCEGLPLAKLLDLFGITLHTVTGLSYTESGKIIQNETELPKAVQIDLGCKLVKDSLGY